MRYAYDSIYTEKIPASALIVAGYVDGRYTTFSKGWRDGYGVWHRPLTETHPNALRISIGVFSNSVAQLGDCESGDMTPAQSVDWVLRNRSLGGDPIVYCSTSWWPAVKAAFASRNVPLPWWWEAHYGNHVPVLHSDPRAVGIQYTDGQYPSAPFNVPGVDTSMILDHLPGVDPGPAPTPTPAKDEDMYIGRNTGGLDQWSIDANTKTHIPDIATLANLQKQFPTVPVSPSFLASLPLAGAHAMHLGEAKDSFTRQLAALSDAELADLGYRADDEHVMALRGTD
jgi:hypothetical protein